jgi:hypothetical protein
MEEIKLVLLLVLCYRNEKEISPRLRSPGIVFGVVRFASHVSSGIWLKYDVFLSAGMQTRIRQWKPVNDTGKQ